MRHGAIIEFAPYGVAHRWMYIGADRWVNRFGSINTLPDHHSVWAVKTWRQVL